MKKTLLFTSDECHKLLITTCGTRIEMSQQLQRLKSFAHCLLSGTSPAGGYHLQIIEGESGPILQLLQFTIQHVKSWDVGKHPQLPNCHS